MDNSLAVHCINPETNNFLHLRLFTTTTAALTQRFLTELREKHDVFDAVFLVDYTQHLVAALRRSGLRFQAVRHGNRNTVERVFQEVKRPTPSFSNIFSHAPPTAVETWLETFAVW